MSGALRAARTNNEDGSDFGGDGISTAMCINAWTRVRHWSAPERVPVMQPEEAGVTCAAAGVAGATLKDELDPFSGGSVNDDQLDLFFSSDLKLRLSGGLAFTGTMAPPNLYPWTATYAKAAPASTWAREATDRRRRLSVDAPAAPRRDDAMETKLNDAAPNKGVMGNHNLRLPTTVEAQNAPASATPREASSTSPVWTSAVLSPHCHRGNDLAKMERILPADKARPCPEWKRRKKKMKRVEVESRRRTDSVRVILEEVNARDPWSSVPEVEVMCHPLPESQGCHVPLSNCNAVSEKSSYAKRGWPPRSDRCRHKCKGVLGWGHDEVNWVTLLSLLTLCCSVLVAPCGAKICNSVQLKEDMNEWQSLLGNCSVIEGSLVITTGEFR